MSRTMLTAALSIALAFTTGCTGVMRSVVKDKVQHTFESTMIQGSELTDLGGGLYTYRWMTYRTIFLVGPKGVVLFDPLNREAAAELKVHIARVAPGKAITHLIYSHDHRDHVSGAEVLGPEVAIVAHEDAAASIAREKIDGVRAPTQTVSGAVTKLDVEGLDVQLVHLPHAHGEGMLAAHLPGHKALFAVDLVWPDELVPPAAPLSFAGVRHALDRLLELDFERFIAGRGAGSGGTWRSNGSS
ncbi:MAG: MBL fold metallo-hydrolase [Polyangiaceae bacterium]